jgi:hypothetical protein
MKASRSWTSRIAIEKDQGSEIEIFFVGEVHGHKSACLESEWSPVLQAVSAGGRERVPSAAARACCGGRVRPGHKRSAMAGYCHCCQYLFWMR